MDQCPYLKVYLYVLFTKNSSYLSKPSILLVVTSLWKDRSWQTITANVNDKGAVLAILEMHGMKNGIDATWTSLCLSLSRLDVSLLGLVLWCFELLWST